MNAGPVSRLILAGLCGTAIAAGISPRGTAAQTNGVKERYNAVAVNLNGGAAATGIQRVLISIDRWSTAAEREKLLALFVAKGPDKLLDALQDNKSVGSLRLPNTLAWDLRYAFETPLPEGGRRVVLATDRPISMREARDQPRSVDYPFTLIEIRFNKAGVGEGRMAYATKIVLSKDKKTVELENFGREPVRLSEVTIEK
jgi:hypothetical protein